MLKLLRILLIGHDHKWKTLAEVRLEEHADGNAIATGRRYFQQCETCGKVVKRDLIG